MMMMVTMSGDSVESLWSQCRLSGVKTNKKHANTKGVCGGPMAKQALFVESDICGAQRCFEGAQIGTGEA